MDYSKLAFTTRAIHIGSENDPSTGAIIPPIHVSSVFEQPGAGEWGQFDYSRSGNPTRKNLETTLAALDGGAGALAFASGMAATHCVTMLLNSGDHIVAGADIYGGTYRLLHKIINRSGIEVTLVDATKAENVRAAMRPNTKLVWIETPGNPLMSVTDIAACAEVAHQGGALLGVDNSLPSPALTRPIEFGADVVMYSATKYLAGHSDVIGGALVAKEKELFDRLWFTQNATGAVMSPFDSFLVSRGLKTLQLRVEKQSQAALVLAHWLQKDPRITRVLYAGLPSHPGHDVAKRQMKGGFGGLFTIEVKGDFAKVKRVAESTKLFALAVSFGAVESLIEQPASMSHASYAPADRAAHGITDGLLRLSVGLEAVDDLKADLDQALNA